MVSVLSALLGTLLATQHGVVARVVRYNWHVTQSEAAYDGVKRLVYGINGGAGHDHPIDVMLGDTVEVWIKNEINEPTCIHWHGMEQSGTIEFDGASGITQCGIAPGASTLYRFTPSMAGTFWWHSHEGTQYVDGLRGPLIVRSRDRPDHQQQQQQDAVHRQFVVEIDDWYHEQSAVLLNEMMANPSGNEPVWDTVLINNRGKFNCNKLTNSSLSCSNVQPLTFFRFQPGQRYLLRLINTAAFAAFDFSIDEHEFRVVAVDGINVQPSKLLNSIRLNVGQRYDIVVHAKSECIGQYWMRATSLYGDPWTSLPIDDFPPGFNPHGLAVIDYNGKQQQQQQQQQDEESHWAADDGETLLTPSSQPWTQVVTVGELDFVPMKPAVLPSKPDHSIRVLFTMQNTPVDPVVRGYLSIDGAPLRTFEMPMSPTLFDIAMGNSTASLPPSTIAVPLPYRRHVEIILMNMDAGEHPFHMHGHAPWVVGSGTMPSSTSTPTNLKLHHPLQRDVYTVPGCTVDTDGECIGVGYTVLRLDTDNFGTWMLHCHIEWHLATGLAMVFVEGEQVIQHRGLGAIAPSMRETCSGKHY